MLSARSLVVLVVAVACSAGCDRGGPAGPFTPVADPSPSERASSPADDPTRLAGAPTPGEGPFVVPGFCLDAGSAAAGLGAPWNQAPARPRPYDWIEHAAALEAARVRVTAGDELYTVVYRPPLEVERPFVDLTVPICVAEAASVRTALVRSTPDGAMSVETDVPGAWWVSTPRGARDTIATSLSPARSRAWQVEPRLAQSVACAGGEGSGDSLPRECRDRTAGARDEVVWAGIGGAEGFVEPLVSDWQFDEPPGCSTTRAVALTSVEDEFARMAALRTATDCDDGSAQTELIVQSARVAQTDRHARNACTDLSRPAGVELPFEPVFSVPRIVDGHRVCATWLVAEPQTTASGTVFDRQALREGCALGEPRYPEDRTVPYSVLAWMQERGLTAVLGYTAVDFDGADGIERASAALTATVERTLREQHRPLCAALR